MRSDGLVKTRLKVSLEPEDCSRVGVVLPGRERWRCSSYPIGLLELSGGGHADENATEGMPKTEKKARQWNLAGSWRWWTLLAACSAAVLVSFRDTLRVMVETWYSSRTYSHCFLILPLFVYLLWVRRESFAGLKFVPNGWGLALLGGLTFLWLLGNVG